MNDTQTPRTSDHAHVAFHPPFLLLGAIAAGFALRALQPAAFLPPPWPSVAGPAVVGAALTLFAWAIVTMRRGNASIPTHTPTDALVCSGPFTLSRNPIYLSMVALMLGLALWADSLWFLGLAVLMVFLLSWGVIAREERYLEQKFGGSYSRYKSRVRRWL